MNKMDASNSDIAKSQIQESLVSDTNGNIDKLELEEQAHLPGVAKNESPSNSGGTDIERGEMPIQLEEIQEHVVSAADGYRENSEEQTDSLGVSKNESPTDSGGHDVEFTHERGPTVMFYGRDVIRRISHWDIHINVEPTWKGFISYSLSQKGRELSQGTSYSIAMFLTVLCLSLIFSEVLHTSSGTKVTVQQFFVAMFMLSGISVSIILVLGVVGKLTKDEHYKHREKINFIRGGMVVLGTGAIIYRSMLFVVYIISPDSCRNDYNFVLSITGTFFTIVQIAMLLIFTKVHINYNLGVSILGRFLVMLVIATNLCVWLATVVTESVEEIHKAEEEGVYDNLQLYDKFPPPADVSAFDTHSVLALQDRLAGMGPTRLAAVIELAMNANGTLESNTTSNSDDEKKCEDYTDFVHLMIPYLFPMMIEFCVVASSMNLAIWENCGVGLNYKEVKWRRKMKKRVKTGKSAQEEKNIDTSTRRHS